MHDVPHRRSAPTLRGTLERARVLPWMDPDAGYFRPAILTRDRSSLELREVSFRPVHTRLLRSAGPPVRIERATWVMERVYDNHSHWLTAHLPKLRLLRDEGALDDVLLPPSLTATMAASLRMLGIEAERLRTFDPSRPLDVERLTVSSTDRFRPELLRPTRDAIAPADTVPTRRIYVSRARAKRRRLLNEDRIWGLLKESGFERVFMEDHDFEWQVQLMKSTRVLFAPHGAGLTNMMFCPEGAQIVEIANLGFPNPNFYALSAAMGHDYSLIPAAPVGDVHPLEQDLVVDPADVARVVEQLSASSRPA